MIKKTLKNKVLNIKIKPSIKLTMYSPKSALRE